MPIPSGGPRPMNTLVGPQSNAPSASVIGNVLGTSSRILKGLFAPNSMGNNGGIPWSATPSSQPNGSEHTPKRMKLAHPGPLREIYTHGEGDSDDCDVLSKDGIEHGQRQISVDRARPGISVATSLPAKQNGMLRTASSEHETVEAMMDSSKYARKAEEEQQRRRGRPSKRSQMQPRQTPTAAIDLTESESPVRVVYRGTARGGTFVGASSKRPETGHTSPFFRGKAPSDNVATKSSFSPPEATSRPKHGGEQDAQLSKQFRQANGKRRGSDLDLSSDELAEVDDYRTVSRVPPEKPPGQFNPSKQRQDTILPTMLSEMEPSSIRPTKFRNSSPKQAVHASRSKRQKRDELPEWKGVEAKSIVIGETFLIAGDKVLGLSFDEEKTALEVWYKGFNLSQRHPSLSIPIQKILHIFWSPECPKVRLVCSRSSHQSSPQVDLELTSGKDAANLARELQSRTGKADEKDRTHMDRIFEKRKSELQARQSAARDEIEDDDDDIQLLERRIRLREKKSSEKLQGEPGNTKQKRSGSNVIDGLVGTSSRVSGEQTETVLPQKSRPQWFQSNTESNQTTNTTRKHTDIDEMLRRINPQGRDSRLTRATRSIVATGGAAVQQDDPFSVDDELPEELRYSKLHGLGKPWKKALIYPKTGKKKTSVEFGDLERLDDGQFLNDNLIGFYLRYLECRLEQRRPDIAKKVYWFNTYFFASLTQTARGKRGVNYEAVRKWTRTIDIFTYDYAVVPINESAHWYVAIICNLRALNRMPEVGGGDGPSSPPYERLEGAEDVESVPEHNPLQSAGFIDSRKEGDELENPEDKGARESFAGLQLEDRDPAGNEDERAAAHSEDELLDDGKVVNVPSSQVQLSGTPPEPRTDKDTIVAQASITANTPTPQRGRKRKSMPPLRSFNPGQPAIITLDSLGLAHSPTVRALKDYLHSEMEDKRGGMQWEDSQMKGITAKQIPLQNNYCDCGLFLLGYMDKFVEGPKDFVTKLLRREYDEKKDWPNLNPSAMRTNIRELVQDLHAEQEGERLAVKRKSPVKASAGSSTEEQATNSPQKEAEEQFLSNAKIIDAVSKLQDQAGVSGADEVPGTVPATREEALQTALRFDAPDHTSSNLSVDEHPLPGSAKHPEPYVPDLPPIVLDSQEEPTVAATATIHTIQDDDDEPHAKLVEPVMEIPDTPPRPKTRGKPTPDPEPPKITASPARGRKPEEAMKFSAQQNRDVITIADS